MVDDPLIGQVLLNNGYGTDDVRAAVEQFDAADESNVSDLGESESGATTAIDAALKKTSLAQPKRDAFKVALLDAWNTWHRAAGAPNPVAPASSIKAALDKLTLSDADRKAVQAKLDEQKLVNLADFGGTPETASAKIKTVVEAAVTDPTTRDMLQKALLAAWKSATKPTSPPQPPNDPPEPPVTTTVPSAPIDFSHWPTLRAETGSGIQTFKVPDLLNVSGEGDPPVSPLSIPEWQWLAVAGNCSLMTALNLNKVARNAEDSWADKPAFLWQRRSGAVNLPPKRDKVESVVDSTFFDSAASESLLAKGSVSGQYLFAEASIKGSAQSLEAQQLYCKRVFMRARYKSIACDLKLDQCLVPSPAFVHFTKQALGLEGGDPAHPKSSAQKFADLQVVFEVFGHVMPTDVSLGGILEIYHEVVSEEGKSTSRITDSVDTAVKVKVGLDNDKKAAADLTFGYAVDDSGAVTGGHFVEKEEFSMTGGDRRYITQPAKWWPSVNAPGTWALIQRGEVRATYQFLDSATSRQIDDVTGLVRKAAWLHPDVLDLLGESRDPEIALTKTKLPVAPLPFFHSTAPVTLRNWGDGANSPYLRPRDGRPDAEKGIGFNATANVYAVDAAGADADGTQVGPGDQSRVQGQYYPWLEPAPDRATLSEGDHPKENNLFWRIVWTGQMTTDNEPEYWIVTNDGNWVLSAFRQLDGNGGCVVAYVVLYPYALAKRYVGVDHPCKWLLQPAVPPGNLQFDWRYQGSDRAPAHANSWFAQYIDPTGQNRSFSAGYFKIFHPKTGGYLAGVADCSGVRRVHTHTDPVPLGPPLSGWTEAQDNESDSPGITFHRTLLRYQPAVATDSVYDARTERNPGEPNPSFGKPDAGRQAEQQQAFKALCWLIQDWSSDLPFVDPAAVKQLNTDVDHWEARARPAS